MKALPLITDDIGFCQESCPAYDGKRCKLTGFKPDSICEPWVRELVQQRNKLRDEVKFLNTVLSTADQI